MKRTTRKQVARFPRRIVTTLGELIAAAYEAAGPGQARTDRAADLLTRSPLSKAMNRHLEFVKV
jgi:hypothetical protein